MMVGQYQQSPRSRRNVTTQGRSYSYLDTAGDAVRDYLRTQARTDLPFKLSNYRPDGEKAHSLLARILTDYDVRRAILDRPCHPACADLDADSWAVIEILCSRVRCLSGVGSTHGFAIALETRRRVAGLDLGEARASGADRVRRCRYTRVSRTIPLQGGREAKQRYKIRDCGRHRVNRVCRL